jgi:hypothetical protein
LTHFHWLRSSCSSSCGSGTQTRSVLCQSGFIEETCQTFVTYCFLDVRTSTNHVIQIDQRESTPFFQTFMKLYTCIHHHSESFIIHQIDEHCNQSFSASLNAGLVAVRDVLQSARIVQSQCPRLNWHVLPLKVAAGPLPQCIEGHQEVDSRMMVVYNVLLECFLDREMNIWHILSHCFSTIPFRHETCSRTQLPCDHSVPKVPSTLSECTATLASQ